MVSMVTLGHWALGMCIKGLGLTNPHQRQENP
jgi:hypothetical protein